jgi:hypothetical protein
MRRSAMPSGIIMTHAAASHLPRVLPHCRLACSPRPHRCGQRRGDPGPAPRERGPAPAEPQAASGLGRPGGARRPDQAPTSSVEGPPARHPGHRPRLAPAAGRPALELSQPVRPAADRPGHRRTGRADGPIQPRLGLPAHPRRTARPRTPDRCLHDPPDPQTPAHTTRAGAPRPHHLATIPPHPGVDHAGL